MRLNNFEVEAIKKSFKEVFKSGEIYLFGSRVDDTKKGGDIDLFIISKEAKYESKLKVSSKLEYLLNKPVDIVLHKNFSNKIEQEALKGIEL